eukprot:181842-Rhodomonas_salina.2
MCCALRLRLSRSHNASSHTTRARDRPSAAVFVLFTNRTCAHAFIIMPCAPPGAAFAGAGAPPCMNCS